MVKQKESKFVWDDETIKLYQKAQKIITDNKGFTRPQEYVDLLVESCAAEKSFHEGLEYFLTKLKEMGLEVETDQQGMQNFGTKIFDLRFKRILINAAGLERFEDHIMTNEINRLYQTPVVVAPPARKK